jgi:multiple sugar transport system substrate-binding protein
VVHWSARSLQAFADYPVDRLVEEYDVVVIDHPHIPLAAGQGLLVPLDETGHDAELEVLAHQSVGLSHATYGHGGHQYGLAIDAAAQVSAHRPDRIGELPRTWPDVVELARDGQVLWPGKPVDAMSSFLTLAAQKGEPVCSGPNVFVSRETGLAVLDLLHELARLAGPSCLTDNPIAVAEQLSCAEDRAYCPLAFGYVNYSRPGFRPHRLAYRDIPAGPRGVAGSCLGGAGIAVSARSRQRSAAVGYAFWLAGAQVQRDDYYWLGGQPANLAAWEDARVNADSWDFFTGTRATLDGASVRPRYAGWVELQESVGNLVHAALAGKISDDACLEGLERERERTLAPGGGDEHRA